MVDTTISSNDKSWEGAQIVCTFVLHFATKQASNMTTHSCCIVLLVAVCCVYTAFDHRCAADWVVLAI